MTRSGTKAYTRVVPDRVVIDLRSKMPMLVANISSAIQAEVPAYQGSALGDRRKRIEGAVIGGLTELLGLLIGRGRADAAVEDGFRGLGLAEGLAGAQLEPMQSAVDVAVRQTWTELHRAVHRHTLSAAVVVRVVDMLFEQATRVRTQIEAGYREGAQQRRVDPRLASRALAALLLGGSQVDEIRRLADLMGHSLPDELLIVSVTLKSDLAPSLDAFDSQVLVASTSTEAVVMADSRLRDDLLKQIPRAFGQAPTAISFACRPDEIVDAVRLTRRALRLVVAGVIPAAPIVDCADHDVALWLHAEPMLRARLASRWLTPFASKTPHRRAVLGQTLLLWLEQRASAPSIAAQLGVHPQTIRSRMRDLEKMFGEDLQDPDRAFAAMLVLKASVHDWIPPAP